MTSPVPTTNDIEEIALDVVSPAGQVNRRITRAYHGLSEGIRRELPSPDDLDWCGFAKWSSHTVGQNFDRAAHTGRLDRLLTHPALDELEPALRAALRAVLQFGAVIGDRLADDALRLGNAVIFLEMGSVFARMLERLNERASLTDVQFARSVVEDVLSTDRGTPADPLTFDQLVRPDPEHLERGIVFYLRAAREPASRAELMLAGNMSFSTYEQERAGTLITIGTCAAARTLALRLVAPTPPRTDEDVLLSDRAGQDPRFAQLDEVTARILTELVLVVNIAGRSVPLGDPDALPEGLATTLPDVTDLLARVAAAGADAPRDWTDLAYRLAFIRRYFAAFQQNAGATADPLGGA